MEAEFADELEAAFASSASDAAGPEKFAPIELVEAVLENFELVDRIIGYLPVSHINIGLVSRCFDAVHQMRLRGKCRALLAGFLPLTIASAVESAVHTGTGRAGPGEYNARARRLAHSLRTNEELRARVTSGQLSTTAFASLNTEDLSTSEQKARLAVLQQEAVDMARRRPAPADIFDMWACQACGCTRQWRRRVVRQGDVAKYSETAVCIECRALVDKSKPLFEIGSSFLS